jgi:hypothetical protein
MSEVPEPQQGTAIRAIRGKELHDSVVTSKKARRGELGPIPRNAFVHGARNESEVFSRLPYVGDNYENKKDQRTNERADHRAKIHSGPVHIKTNIHEPFQPDMYLYNGPYDGAAIKPAEEQKKLEGTRFCKSKSQKEPWRPNNPAKKGYNMTINKPHYYHQTLYYKPKDLPKVHEENLWIPNYNGTLEKPQRDYHRFYRNGRVRHNSQGLLPYHPTRKQLLG